MYPGCQRVNQLKFAHQVKIRCSSRSSLKDRGTGHQETRVQRGRPMPLLVANLAAGARVPATETLPSFMNCLHQYQQSSTGWTVTTSQEQQAGLQVCNSLVLLVVTVMYFLQILFIHQENWGYFGGIPTAVQAW